MTRMAVLAISFALGMFAGFDSDLSTVLAETNLEKRSRLALENANRALDEARTAYESGEFQRSGALLTEVKESAELAETSLNKTGKNPRKNPKWFKKAEIETRKLVKKLDAFRNDMSVADHAQLDQVKLRVQKIHDDLLVGLMEGRAK